MDKKEREKILTLSASKITLWNYCPMAFFLRYVEHLKTKEKVSVVFGKAIHAILKMFYEKEFKNEETLKKYWKYYWSEKCSTNFQKQPLETKKYSYKDGELELRSDILFGEDPIRAFFGYMRLGENILERFYKENKNKEPPKFKEMRKTVTLFGHKVIVIFDRIDEINGKLYITDYKTDRINPKDNSFVINKNPQLTLYSLAFREVFKKEEEAIKYYHLRSGDIFETRRNKEDFEYLEEIINKTAREIEHALDKNIFLPFYGYKCNFCESKDDCEKYLINSKGPTRFNNERKIEEISSISMLENALIEER